MNRIDTLVNYIDENKVVADIGSDHGITAIKVYEEKNPVKVIATDISKNSLQKLVDKLEVLKYDIDTIVTDGLIDLPHGVQQIIISGMGGYLIQQILEEGYTIAKNAEKLILQGNNSLEHLRRWLHENNFMILDETTLEDEGFVYTIIVAKYTNKYFDKYEDDFAYIYGYKQLKEKNIVTINSIKKEVERLRNIYEKLVDIDTDETIDRIEELEKEIGRLDELLCKLES